MKKICTTFLFVLAISIPHQVFSQTTFTKVITGSIVTDGGESWGCSWGDYDGDGRPDLLVVNRNVSLDVHIFLYHNEGSGAFIRVLSNALLNDSAKYTTATFGDYDNDGKLDLFFSTFNNQNNMLYHNEGIGVFTRILSGIIVNDGGSSNNCSWIDFNNDGKLDMCVTNYGQRKYLYQGDGAGVFTKITTGAFVNDISPSVSSSWGDYNNDGLVDVYVANNGVINNNFFYKNDGTGNFTKITSLNITTDTTKSFSTSWGDYNNDGFPDLFVAADGSRNNALYRNNRDGSFTNETSSVIALDQYSVMGNWADYDNDGFLDLFVSRWQNQNNLLYHNNGNGTFTKVTTGNIVNDHGNSFGCAWADYDNDGDMDLIVANINNENNFLYRNNAVTENSNKWINVKCVGITSNKSAIGAKVMVKANINGTSQWQLREIIAGTGYASQNDIRAHFGLGSASVVDSIKIVWPSGAVNSFTNIGVNRFVTITENGSLVNVSGSESKSPSGFELQQNYPNPFNPVTSIRFTVPFSSNVILKIYNTSGKEVHTLLNQKLVKGSHEIEWNAVDLPSGVYYYTLTAENYSDTKKMVLIK